jgi:uncharacterized protein YbjT (DUF2867 family)
VRGSSRDPKRLARIAALGAEPFRGDPDRIGSLLYAFDGVTVVCWLLGSATGPGDRVEALNGTRLKMLFAKLVDTTVRGVLYEAAGAVEASALARGREVAARASETWEIPVALLEADPGDAVAWAQAARRGVDRLLLERSGV